MLLATIASLETWAQLPHNPTEGLGPVELGGARTELELAEASKGLPGEEAQGELAPTAQDELEASRIVPGAPL